MRYTKLGNADLTVSRVCLGCMGFGDPARGQHTWTLDEERSRAIIRQALEAAGGDKRQAMKQLDIKKSSFYERLRHYGIN